MTGSSKIAAPMAAQTNLTIAMAIIVATVALGFVAWWTFVLVAFAAGFYLAKHKSFRRPIMMATLAPAFGWVITALIRDIVEGGRISAKLATLLHVRFAVAIYLVLFLMVVIPSFFAAYSASEASKAFR